METFQNIMGEMLQKIPYRIIAKYVSTKIENESGIKLNQKEMKRLVQALQQQDIKTFKVNRWHLWRNKSCNISLSEDNIKEIFHIIDDFSDSGIRNIIDGFLEEMSSYMYNHLSRTWRPQKKYNDNLLNSFNKNLNDIWGEAISKLEMLITTCSELGSRFNYYFGKDIEREMPTTISVLLRLHARACQIAMEIVCLLRSGFADGAMARWRTLHEIATVSIFIKKHKENTAIRYLEHQNIESYKGAVEYNNCCDSLQYEPFSDIDIEIMREKKDDLIKKYGESYYGDYGWASDIFGNKRTTFRDIETDSDIWHLRSHYKMASQNVHANTRGIYYRLGLLGDSNILLCGPSNAGLADPGQCCALSLIQVTTSLILLKNNADTIIYNKLIQTLCNEIGHQFITAQQKLEKLTERYGSSTVFLPTD